jgi:hypothetical protein
MRIYKELGGDWIMNDENDMEEMSYDFNPSNDEVEETNPWREPISYITWGLVLTSFTLNFFLLQYILPTIGVILLYLGTRNLRRVNRWFFAAWILTMIKLFWYYIQLIIYATPIFLLYKNNMFISAISIIFQIILLLVLRNAIQGVYRQASITPTRDPLLLAIIWTVLIAVCAIYSLANNWIVIIPLIIFYITIYRSLYSVGGELSGTDYIFVNASVKVRDNVIIWGYFISCLILVFISCISANHIELNESLETATTDSKTRAELIELGFPENIIVDISDEDISMLSGAIHIDSSSDLLTFRQPTQTVGNNNSHSNKTEKSTLQATTIYIEFPNNHLYVLVHFDWMENKSYWQDGFTIMGEEGFELLNGVLLYNRNGTRYTAPIPRLKNEVVTSYSYFGAKESRQISGAVSFPFASERQRGYIFYHIQFSKDRLAGVNLFNYVHYNHPFQLPYDETEKRILNGSFIFKDNMKQQYTNFYLHIYRDTNN